MFLERDDVSCAYIIPAITKHNQLLINLITQIAENVQKSEIQNHIIDK